MIPRSRYTAPRKLPNRTPSNPAVLACLALGTCAYVVALALVLAAVAA